MKRVLVFLTLLLTLVIPAGCGDDDNELLKINDIVGIWKLKGDVNLTENSCNFPDLIAKDARVFRVEIDKEKGDYFNMYNCEMDDTCANEELRGNFMFGSELQMKHPDFPFEVPEVSSCRVVFSGLSKLAMKDGTTSEATVDVDQTATRTVGEGVTDADAECAKLKAALEANLAQQTEGTKEYQNAAMAVMIVTATTSESCSIKRSYDIEKLSK